MKTRNVTLLSVLLAVRSLDCRFWPLILGAEKEKKKL